MTWCLKSQATVGVSIGTGYGVASIIPIRLSFQKMLDTRWEPCNTWPIASYIEGSFYSMHGRKGVEPNSHRYLKAVALAGFLRFERPEALCNVYPYIELGIGASWLSQKEIGGRDLGFHYQFEDRLGIGLRFGPCLEYEIGYKAVHFSNAYLGPRNHGINLHMLVLNYWFS